jgi:hypothetical protein
MLVEVHLERLFKPPPLENKNLPKRKRWGGFHFWGFAQALSLVN